MKFLDVLRARLAELAEKREAALAEMEAVTAAAESEQRAALTDEETVRFDEAKAKIAEIDTEVEQVRGRIEELEEIERRNLAATIAPVDRPAHVDASFDGDIRSLRPAELRDKALKAVEVAARDRDLSDASLRQVERLVRRNDGYIAARTLLTENDAYRSAFVKLTTRNRPVLNPEEAQAIEAFERAMNITTPADGGVGVPVLIDPTIILTAQESGNPFLSIATVKTITTDSWKGVTSAGVSWKFDAESSTVTNNQPTLGQPDITAHKAHGFIPYTIEVGMDYPDFASEMSRLLGAGYDELLVEKFTVGAGDGSNEPYGIFTALDANTNVEVAPTTTGSFAAVDIFKVWKALPQKYRRNASWLMNVDVNNEIRGFGDEKLYQQTVNLTAGAVDLLMGRPVHESPYAPEFTGTTGAANILVVGDFSHYVIVQRAGMSVELVPHLFDVTNNRPTGERGWYAWARVGADSANDLAFRILSQ